MKRDNRTGKLPGELYHSRKDSKIENYVPGIQHKVGVIQRPKVTS